MQESEQKEFHEDSHHERDHMSQLCGFKVGNELYAIPVLDVQEVVKFQMFTNVPHAPSYIKGLINLRGQIVTAISLHDLLGIESRKVDGDYMNVIVRSGDSLYSLIVDEILDVIDIEENRFEPTPDAISSKVRGFLSGVYKLDKEIIMLLNLEKTLNIEE